jgi:hypothetical protein
MKSVGHLPSMHGNMEFEKGFGEFLGRAGDGDEMDIMTPQLKSLRHGSQKNADQHNFLI